MKKIYYKSLLLYIQIVLAGTLLFFVLLPLFDDKRYILKGYTLSILIMGLYVFLLYKSFHYWQKERTGLAYFITIVGFLTLSFLQITTCILNTSFDY